MLPKDDMSKKPTIQRGPVPSLDQTFSVLLVELLPYRNFFQQLRSRIVLFFLKLINRPVQKKLQKLQADGDCDWFAESIDRTYLECRDSLAYFNAYTVYLLQETKSDYFERLTNVLRSVQQLIVKNPDLSRALRTYRVPEPVCDRLIVPTSAGYGVLLCHGKIIPVPSGTEVSGEQLQEYVLTAKESITHDTHQLCLGEVSALLREDWYDVLRLDNDAGILLNSVELIRRADFVLCIDAEVASQQWELKNRFFDKAVQIVVKPDATFLIFEHAAIDGEKAVSLSESIAVEYFSNVGSAAHSHKNCSYRPAQVWAPQVVTLPEELITKGRAYLAKVSSEFSKTRHFFPSFGKGFFGNVAEGFEGSVSADNIVQLAVALTFFRLRNKLPSIYEPVSLAHLAPRRLDFISPLSPAAAEFIQLFDSADGEILRKTLIGAISAHRAKIRRSKMGEGALSHLLALASAEFHEDKIKCVRVQRERRRLLSRLSKTIDFMAHRDVMVSNGGASTNLESFSTILHQPNMVGIGYLLGARGLSVDLQLHGIYKDMFRPNVLACQIVQAIHDVAYILVPDLVNHDASISSHKENEMLFNMKRSAVNCAGDIDAQYLHDEQRELSMRAYARREFSV